MVKFQYEEKRDFWRSCGEVSLVSDGWDDSEGLRALKPNCCRNVSRRLSFCASASLKEGDAEATDSA